MSARTVAARWVARCRMPSFGALCVALALPAHAPATNRIGMHSMLFLDHPYSAKAAMFKEAAAVGASEIRLDIAVASVFPDPGGAPDWTGVDQYMGLARRYHLRVLADLLATPWYLADCPAGTPFTASYLCAPSDPVAWAHRIAAIAAHTRGVIDHFEIVNEPDGAWAFLGSPQQYAGMLAAAHSAIHDADPAARVVLGGLMDIGETGEQWMDAMLASLGTDAIHDFDIANVHVRGHAADTRHVVARWRRYFTRHGFGGPLWVTEAGYSADPSYQNDPAYQGGADAQARYLTAAVPAMIRAGAAKVFITERDAMSGPFASEGILDTSDPLTADPHYTRRPSFAAVRKMTLRRRSSKRLKGLEPSTFCMASRRSSQLSYSRKSRQYRRCHGAHRG